MVGDWLYWEKTLPGFQQSAQKITLADDPAAKYYDALPSNFTAASANPPKELLNALAEVMMCR